MARGVVEIPIENGKRELSWQVGQAIVKGTNEVNPIVSLKTERDADFLAKRAWLVQWPNYGAPANPNLPVPVTTSILPKDGGTNQALSLVAGYAPMMYPDMEPRKQPAAAMGLPCPFLMKANTAFYLQMSNPAAAGTPWTGDLYLIYEGYKVFPFLPEDIPAKVQSYGVPFELNANASILSPSAAAQNITGQFITISNSGIGKFLAKGMKVAIIDAAGVDKTDILSANCGFQIIDSTAGNKRWIDNTLDAVVNPMCPLPVLTMNRTNLPFNHPRYIDPAGTVKIQVVWSDLPASIAYVAANAAFPVTFSVSLYGAMLPM